MTIGSTTLHVNAWDLVVFSFSVKCINMISHKLENNGNNNIRKQRSRGNWRKTVEHYKVWILIKINDSRKYLKYNWYLYRMQRIQLNSIIFVHGYERAAWRSSQMVAPEHAHIRLLFWNSPDDRAIIPHATLQCNAVNSYTAAWKKA